MNNGHRRFLVWLLLIAVAWWLLWVLAAPWVLSWLGYL